MEYVLWRAVSDKTDVILGSFETCRLEYISVSPCDAFHSARHCDCLFSRTVFEVCWNNKSNRRGRSIMSKLHFQLAPYPFYEIPEAIGEVVRLFGLVSSHGHLYSPLQPDEALVDGVGGTHHPGQLHQVIDRHLCQQGRTRQFVSKYETEMFGSVMSNSLQCK